MGRMKELLMEELDVDFEEEEEEESKQGTVVVSEN
jgi:hypothetical protein